MEQRIMDGGRNNRNPLYASTENIEEGRKIFSRYCIVCRGLDGRNVGVPFVGRMSAPIPPLNSLEVQSYTDGQLRWVIENGIYASGMPASKGILNEEVILKIVAFLRHLPPKGSLGEPAIYSQ